MKLGKNGRWKNIKWTYINCAAVVFYTFIEIKFQHPFDKAVLILYK